MSHSSKYYDKFLSKLKNRNLVKSNDDSWINLSQASKPTNEEFLDIYSKNKLSSIKHPGVHRKSKMMIKQQSSNFTKFTDSMSNIKYDTMLDYAQVISDLVKFSPESKIEDYVNYLKFKSGCPTLNNNEDFVVKGTVVKYANIIRRYLFSLYQMDIPKVKIDYFRKPKQRKIDPIPKLTKEDVFKFYQTLASKEKIEDAVMIHMMYELGLEPYNLCLLTFESMNNSKAIELWDHKSKQIVSIKFPESLYGEFEYLKVYRRLCNKLNESEQRYSLDGTLVEGTFIFQTKPTGIFNKFKRKFGGLLRNFDFTPWDLILLSRFKEKLPFQRLYLCFNLQRRS